MTVTSLHAQEPQHPTPSTPEEITPAWLSSVLKHPVTSLKITQIIPGTATKVLISVTYGSSANGPLPTTFCIKGGLEPGMLQAIPFLHTLFDREVAFYTHMSDSLVQDGMMDLPKCYHANNGLLVLEDLSPSSISSNFPSRSIKFGTPTKPFSLTAVMSGVEQLAALHAKTWNLSPTPDWLIGQEKHYENAILHMMQNYEVVVRGADRAPIPEYMKDQNRMVSVLTKHYELEEKAPRYRALLHGDAHVSNTYLVLDGDDNTAEEKTRFLDWQMVHIGSPFRDLAYFVVGALDIQTRRDKEWDVVGHYLRALERFGGPRLLNASDGEIARDHVPDGVVKQEYKRGMLAGLGPIVCPYEMQPREWVFPMAERYAAAIDDHGVVELVEGL